MEVGYARVSTVGQNFDRQIAALRSGGIQRIYRQKSSGKSLRGRTELENAIDALGTGNVLVIAERDRATPSMMDGINILQRIADRGATVLVLDRDFLDLTSTMGKGILAFLSAIAQDQHERFVRPAPEGRKQAAALDVKMGLGKALTDHQTDRVRERVAVGETRAIHGA